MDAELLVTGGIGLLTTVIGSWSGWFFARKKYDSEVDHNIIENLQASLDFYKTLVDDNTRRLAEVLQRNDELEDRITDLLRKNENLEHEVSTLRTRMDEMVSSICEDFVCNSRKNLGKARDRKKNIKTTKTE